MNRSDKAVELHARGYNCAQSVACAFSDLTDIPESLLYRVSEGFGNGMGTGYGMCGALSGASLLIGPLLNGVEKYDTEILKQKRDEAFNEIIDCFTSRTNTLICHEIKSGRDGEPIISCDECIVIAVNAVEKVFNLQT